MRKKVRIAAYLLVLTSLPSWASALTFPEARHLLARTSFGTNLADIELLRELDRAEAATHLLEQAGHDAETPAPEWVDDPLPDRATMRSMDDEQRMEKRKQNRARGRTLKAWWYEEMIITDSPLTEKMTLFWHNHFTSSLKKVRSPQLIYRQNQLLRRHALGSFRELLHAISRDAAMLVYLDNHSNRAGNPNENFARELLELFTLGEGYYSEQDIKEAARAFTGWSVDRKTGDHQLRPRQHDQGVKTFLGHNGNWDGSDIVEIILEQPRTAVHITEKVWRELVDDAPPPDTIEAIASIFRDSDYDIARLLYAVLTSDEFYDPAVYATQIKSPVELLVGTVRTLGLPLEDGRLLVRAGRGLGQDLFDPPNVKGWPGGESWITSDTLLVRREILERMVEAAGRIESANVANRSVLDAWIDSLGGELSNPSGVRSLLLATEPQLAGASADLVSVARSALLDPVYQLK